MPSALDRAGGNQARDDPALKQEDDDQHRNGNDDRCRHDDAPGQLVLGRSRLDQGDTGEPELSALLG